MTADQNASLQRPFSLEEFTKAVQMNIDKSPGPDGFNPTSFQKFCPLMGKDIFKVCSNWLNNNEFPQALNEATIILIPKTEHPSSMKDLRPIALCNALTQNNS